MRPMALNIASASRSSSRHGAIAKCNTRRFTSSRAKSAVTNLLSPRGSRASRQSVREGHSAFCCNAARDRILPLVRRWADERARERGIKVEGHPVDVLTWDAGAESMRRRQMANAGAHGCIAFPGHAGTEHMIRQARRAGIPIWKPAKAPASDGQG